jgi:signal transduction histidine kinase
VVQDLARAQRRIEATITALGQLASGQLARIEDREPIDVPEMLDRSPENARPGSGVEITVEADDAGTVWGWPAGCGWPSTTWCATPSLTARPPACCSPPPDRGSLTITVDDNGRGLPADEHEKVLGRFARGSTAARVVPVSAWRWWRSRRHCTAGLSNCPTDRSAGCAPG